MGPDEFKKLFKEATALKNKGDAESVAAAKEKLQLVLAHVPSRAKACRTLHLLGVLEWESGDKAKGVELFREAVAAKPEMPAFHWSLGCALDGMESIKHLSEAAKFCPKNIEILTQLAKRQKKSKMMAEAEASYRNLLQLEPEKAHTYYKLGHVMLHKRTEEGYKEAASLFEQCVERDPEHESAKYWSSVATGQAGGSSATPTTAPPSYVQVQSHNGI